MTLCGRAARAFVEFSAEDVKRYQLLFQRTVRPGDLALAPLGDTDGPGYRLRRWLGVAFCSSK